LLRWSSVFLRRKQWRKGLNFYRPPVPLKEWRPWLPPELMPSISAVRNSARGPMPPIPKMIRFSKQSIMHTWGMSGSIWPSTRFWKKRRPGIWFRFLLPAAGMDLTASWFRISGCSASFMNISRNCLFMPAPRWRSRAHTRPACWKNSA